MSTAAGTGALPVMSGVMVILIIAQTVRLVPSDIPQIEALPACRSVINVYCPVPEIIWRGGKRRSITRELAARLAAVEMRVNLAGDLRCAAGDF